MRVHNRIERKFVCVSKCTSQINQLYDTQCIYTKKAIHYRAHEFLYDANAISARVERGERERRKMKPTNLPVKKKQIVKWEIGVNYPRKEKHNPQKSCGIFCRFCLVLEHEKESPKSVDMVHRASLCKQIPLK